VWCVDDDALVGDISSVHAAFEIIRTEAAKIGLRLNLSKCELWWPTMNLQSLSVFPDEPTRHAHEDGTPSPGIKLLGASLGDSSYAEDFLQAKLVGLHKILERLDHPQAELGILCLCHGWSKIAFRLRATPPSHCQQFTHTCDDHRRITLERILRGPVSDREWRQASLPPSLGGVGLFAAKYASTPVFLWAASISHKPLLSAYWTWSRGRSSAQRWWRRPATFGVPLANRPH
jgi:hypothetical protein